MHIVKYIYYPQTQNKVNPTNISLLKNHIKLVNLDIFIGLHAMLYALKMREIAGNCRTLIIISIEVPVKITIFIVLLSS